VGIHLASLTEGCCEYPSSVSLLDGDKLSSNRATCDKVIECNDRYILVEEKSFILGFFNECCNEKGKKLNNFLDKETLIDDFFVFVEESFSTEEKRRLFAESVTKLFMSSLDKVSNTTHFLATSYDPKKSENMPVIYLYCKSGVSKVDKLASISLSKYKNEKKQVMVECSQLGKFLAKKGCA